MLHGLPLLAVLLICLGSSFLFSGMEAGVAALSRLRIRHRARAGDRSATVLHGFLEHPENFLWTILIGNTLANFAAVLLTVAWLHDQLQERRLLMCLALVGLVLLLYTFCELLPKMLFQRFPNRLCLALARPFRLAHFALSPLVGLVEHLSGLLLRWTGGRAFQGHLFGSRDELRSVMQESSATLSNEEQSMINRVLDLQNVSVRDLLVPFEKVRSVDSDTPASEVVRLCRENSLGRLPVWQQDGARRRIAGLVHLNSVLFAPEGGAGRRAGDFLQPAVFLPEDLRLETALERLRRAGQRLAIVVGADGRERGVIGLPDLLKFVFGEVPR